MQQLAFELITLNMCYGKPIAERCFEFDKWSYTDPENTKDLQSTWSVYNSHKYGGGLCKVPQNITELLFESFDLWLRISLIKLNIIKHVIICTFDEIKV